MPSEIQHTNGSSSAIDTSPYVEFGQRYLTFAENTPYEVWSEVVGRLKSAEKSIQWWLGDALRFGERKYGEMYSQALEETDYAYGTLRNAAWVAGKIEPSRRHDNLSFGHHQAVAALPPDEQDYWLDESEPAPGESKPRLSVPRLREEIHAAEVSSGEVEVVKTKVCPMCRGTGEVVEGGSVPGVSEVPEPDMITHHADGSRTAHYVEGGSK